MTLRQVGDYTLLNVIGNGAFARVYECIDKQGRRYAMKVIRKSEIACDQLEKVQTEAEIMQTLEHPNIVKVHRIYTTAQRYMLLMDYASEGDLRGILDKQLSEPEIGDLFLQICAAVSYCHCLNLAHRDLKLENILSTAQGKQPLLTDFGFGVISTKTAQNTFMNNTFCGTPLFVAPELVDGAYNAKVADRWSLGIMLYRLVEGEYPFVGRDLFAIIEKAKKHDIKFGKASKEAAELISALLNPDPQKRATWDDVFSSRLFNKYGVVSDTEVTLKSTGYKTPYKPTREQMEKQKLVKHTTTTPIKDQDKQFRCPICQAEINVKQTGGAQSEILKVKKAKPSPWIQNIHHGIVSITGVLQQIKATKINVFGHQQVISAEEIEISIFKPADKFFIKINAISEDFAGRFITAFEASQSNTSEDVEQIIQTGNVIWSCQ